MEFLDLAKKRYSTRRFNSKRVEKEKIVKILEAGRIAPSAGNKQPWVFIVVENEPVIGKIRETYKGDWFSTAPGVIVICGDHKQSWIRYDGKDHCDIDVAIAVDHMTLQAAELGIGTCWVCHFDVKKCSEILNLPDNMEPCVLLPFGYPGDKPDMDRHSSQRKNMDEIVRWE